MADRAIHREVHRSGNEANWWRDIRIDPLLAARALKVETYPPLMPIPNRPRNPTEAATTAISSAVE
jgi:hypothetical protein